MNAVAASLVVALTLSTSAFAQTKQTLTHELMWSFQRVGAPVPSPDGKWVVFSVAEITYDATKDVSDLWIVPADGHAAPRRLTSNKGSESGASWSADSTRLAFAAKRDDDEVAQIYVLEIGLGGEAQRVTNTATAASAPKWSPDGKHLMFQAAMWPGATDEESNRKAVQERKNVKSKVRVYETFPIRNFDRWIDESKPHLWIIDVGRDKKARPLFAGSTLAGKAGYNGDGLSAAWTPDGESIVFAAADSADPVRVRWWRPRSGRCHSAVASRNESAPTAGMSAHRASAPTARPCALVRRTRKRRSTRSHRLPAPPGR